MERERVRWALIAGRVQQQFTCFFSSPPSYTRQTEWVRGLEKKAAGMHMAWRHAPEIGAQLIFRHTHPLLLIKVCFAYLMRRPAFLLCCSPPTNNNCCRWFAYTFTCLVRVSFFPKWSSSRRMKVSSRHLMSAWASEALAGMKKRCVVIIWCHGVLTRSTCWFDVNEIQWDVVAWLCFLVVSAATAAPCMVLEFYWFPGALHLAFRSSKWIGKCSCIMQKSAETLLATVNFSCAAIKFSWKLLLIEAGRFFPPTDIQLGAYTSKSMPSKRDLQVNRACNYVHKTQYCAIRGASYLQRTFLLPISSLK